MHLVVGPRNTKMAKTCPFQQVARSLSGRRYKLIIVTQCGAYSTRVHTQRVLLEVLPNSTFSNQGGLLEVVMPELSLRVSKELAK